MSRCLDRKCLKMRSKYFKILLVSTFLCATASEKKIVKDEEIEVKLQFLEYELEDFCVSKNEAEWEFLNGSVSDLKKLLNIEVRESDFYKNELEVIQKHISKKFSNEKLQRLFDIFSHPGAPLLGETEFKEYRDYSVKLQQLLGTMIIDYPEHRNYNSSEIENPFFKINYGKMNKILYEEKNEEQLKNIWIMWFKNLEEKNKKTKYDFVQQLSILDLEAEQNGEEELAEYWLKQSDATLVTYETLKKFWDEIQPLYQQLQQYMKYLVDQKYGKNSDQKLLPAHLLGSLNSYDWITAAEKLGAFSHSDTYRALNSSLFEKKVEELYKIADNMTAGFKLGYLPKSFYEKSQFSEISQSCNSKKMDFCGRGNVLRVMHCADEVVNLKQYIDINENVMKMKHLLLCSKEEEENGFLFREGPRDSALYEALGGFASIKALSIENLYTQNLSKNSSERKQEILNSLIMALHVIPPLPYYLLSDLWRINALKEIDAAIGENVADVTAFPSVSSTYEESQTNYNVTGDFNYSSKNYDVQNLTKDWWFFREKFQRIKSPEGKFYEDYLEDTKIVWNKPYLSKFLGIILQFQILEYVTTENLSSDALIFQEVMKRGKSQSWETLAQEIFNITEISVKPLLKYFKPLEEFLNKEVKSKNQTRFFDFNDFNFISQGFSLDPSKNKESEKPAEGSDALFFSLAVVAAIGIVAVIVVVGRRRHRKKRQARERKIRLAQM